MNGTSRVALAMFVSLLVHALAIAAILEGPSAEIHASVPADLAIVWLSPEVQLSVEPRPENDLEVVDPIPESEGLPAPPLNEPERVDAVPDVADAASVEEPVETSDPFWTEIRRQLIRELARSGIWPGPTNVMVRMKAVPFGVLPLDPNPDGDPARAWIRGAVERVTRRADVPPPAQIGVTMRLVVKCTAPQTKGENK